MTTNPPFCKRLPWHKKHFHKPDSPWLFPGPGLPIVFAKQPREKACDTASALLHFFSRGNGKKQGTYHPGYWGRAGAWNLFQWDFSCHIHTEQTTWYRCEDPAGLSWDHWFIPSESNDSTHAVCGCFRTYAHMITALNNNEKSYLLQLKRLHGCTEMCVRFISTSPHEGPVEKKNRYCPPKKYLAQRFFNIEKRFMNSKTACRLKFMKKQGSLSSISGELTLNLNRRGTLWERSTPLCLYKGQIKPMAMNCWYPCSFWFQKKTYSCFVPALRRSASIHLVNIWWTGHGRLSIFIDTESNL